MTKMYMRGGVHYGTAAEMMDRIEELEAKVKSMAMDCLVAHGQASDAYQAQLAAEAKLSEAEARSEILETLAMDVAADLYNDVPAHEIDQRIGDVMKQLDDEEEED